MTADDTLIRRMKLEDLALAVDWAAGEGWNPGRHDAESFYAADPDGFFIAEIDGAPVGCISAVAYDEHFGFMGFYIVRKDMRDRGIGMKLWDAAIEYMGDRTIGGDGVVAMLDKYAQCGLQVAHYNARYEGSGQGSDLLLPDLAAVPFEELERYDRRFFPAPRSSFLRNWISRPGSRGSAVMSGSSMAGYGVIRPCYTGYKIGPLFADTPEIAEELFEVLAACAAREKVFLDIPVCNEAALSLVERHGMQKVFETARIYRGTPPALPLDRIFGITSFELG